MAVKYSSGVEYGCSKDTHQRAVVNCVSCIVDWCYTLDEILKDGAISTNVISTECGCSTAQELEAATRYVGQLIQGCLVPGELNGTAVDHLTSRSAQLAKDLNTNISAQIQLRSVPSEKVLSITKAGNINNVVFEAVETIVKLIKEVLYTPVCRARRCGFELEPSFSVRPSPSFSDKALIGFGSPKRGFVGSPSSGAMNSNRESPGDTPNPKKMKTQQSELQEESNPPVTESELEKESEKPEPESAYPQNDSHNPKAQSRGRDSELNKSELNLKSKMKNVKPVPNCMARNLRGISPGRSSLERVRSSKPSLERSKSLHGRSSGQGGQNSDQPSVAFGTLGKLSGERRPFLSRSLTDLEILKKRPKLVSHNGLHQFVLWREAYKGAKERRTVRRDRSRADLGTRIANLGSRVGSGSELGTRIANLGSRVGAKLGKPFF